MIKMIVLLMILSSCNTVKTTTEDKKAYRVINAFLDYYIKETNRGVFLSPLIIEKENYAIFDVFNEEGKLHKEICSDMVVDTNISNNDFNNYIKKQHINRWNYKQIKNKGVVKKLVLDKSAIIKYEKAKKNNMLKTENEWITYKYMLWYNKKNVPLITLSYPFFSNDGDYALLYMTKHNGGGYIFILNKEVSKKWNVVCEKNLFQY